MLIVCGYSDDMLYEGLARNLRESLAKFAPEVPSEFVRFTDKGSWQANVLHKPILLKRYLITYDDVIVWIDADAELVRPLQPALNEVLEQPTADGIPWDFAATMPVVGGNLVLNAAFLVFRPSTRTTRLLYRWACNCENWPKDPCGDQANLWKAYMSLGESQDPARLLVLPGEFSAIVGLDHLGYDYPSDPIVVQRQASRQRKAAEASKRGNARPGRGAMDDAPHPPGPACR